MLDDDYYLLMFTIYPPNSGNSLPSVEVSLFLLVENGGKNIFSELLGKYQAVLHFSFGLRLELVFVVFI